MTQRTVVLSERRYTREGAERLATRVAILTPIEQTQGKRQQRNPVTGEIVLDGRGVPVLEDIVNVPTPVDSLSVPEQATLATAVTGIIDLINEGRVMITIREFKTHPPFVKNPDGTVTHTATVDDVKLDAAGSIARGDEIAAATKDEELARANATEDGTRTL